jgi:hypothetical protein
MGDAPEALDRMSYGGTATTPIQQTGPDPSLAAQYSGPAAIAGMAPVGKIFGIAGSLAKAAPILGAAMGAIKDVSKEIPHLAELKSGLAKSGLSPHESANFVHAYLSQGKSGLVEHLSQADDMGWITPHKDLVHLVRDVMPEDPTAAAAKPTALKNQASLELEKMAATMKNFTPEELAPFPKIEMDPHDPRVPLENFHSPETVAHIKYLEDQGLNAEDAANTRSYTRETFAQLAARMREAQQNAEMKLGLRPGNTIVERRIESPFSSEPLERGSNRRSTEIALPMNLQKDDPIRAGNSTGWPHDMTFAARQGGHYPQTYRYQLPLRSTVETKDLFDPGILLRDQPMRWNEADKSWDLGSLHPVEEKYLNAYNTLKAKEAAGTLDLPPEFWHEAKLKGTPLFNSPTGAIRDWRVKGRNTWETSERPDVVATLRHMGYPGVTINESGANAMYFPPANFRFENAAYDPEKWNSRNLFASLAGGGAGLSALAAMLLPDQSLEQ